MHLGSPVHSFRVILPPALYTWGHRSQVTVLMFTPPSPCTWAYTSIVSMVTVESSSTAQVPESSVRQKNEKHSRKLQWRSGDQHHLKVKVPKLISSLLYYTFWDLFVCVYMSIAGQMAFNDNPVHLTFNIFVSLYFCVKDKDPVNHYVPPRHQR